MNAVYSENYRFPAGVLALVVHGAFFAFLYSGFTWQNKQPAVMSVDLWQSLPDAAPVAPPPPEVQPAKQPEPEVKPVPPPVVVKPDIVMPTKKPVPKPVEVKPVHPVEPKKPVVKQPTKPEVKPSTRPVQPSAAELEVAREQAERAAQAAATGKVVDEYMAKIRDKIKRNIVMPPDVPNDALAVFSVTLLPGGTVLDARPAQSSGNAAYDNAVERAILKSQPLPLPTDPNMFNRFRELKLKFKPVE